MDEEAFKDNDDEEEDGEKFDVLKELAKYTPEEEDFAFEGGLKIPGSIYNHLFEYQKTCAKWLWELHCQETGGIIGDEMGKKD